MELHTDLLYQKTNQAVTVFGQPNKIIALVICYGRSFPYKKETVFDFLDCIAYEGKEYLCLIPDDEESNEIVILEVEPVDEENENYIAVED